VVQEVVLFCLRWLRRSFYDRLETSGATRAAGRAPGTVAVSTPLADARGLDQRGIPVVEQGVPRRFRWLRRSFYDRLETSGATRPAGRAPGSVAGSRHRALTLAGSTSEAFRWLRGRAAPPSVVEEVVLRPSRNLRRHPGHRSGPRRRHWVSTPLADARGLDQRGLPVVEEVVLRCLRWLRRSFYDRLETFGATRAAGRAPGTLTGSRHRSLTLAGSTSEAFRWLRRSFYAAFGG
jgi:hypothetical protein